jgi:hypothetical protein
LALFLVTICVTIRHAFYLPRAAHDDTQLPGHKHTLCRLPFPLISTWHRRVFNVRNPTLLNVSVCARQCPSEYSGCLNVTASATEIGTRPQAEDSPVSWQITTIRAEDASAACGSALQAATTNLCGSVSKDPFLPFSNSHHVAINIAIQVTSFDGSRVSYLLDSDRKFALGHTCCRRGPVALHEVSCPLLHPFTPGKAQILASLAKYAAARPIQRQARSLCQLGSGAVSLHATSCCISTFRCSGLRELSSAKSLFQLLINPCQQVTLPHLYSRFVVGLQATVGVVSVSKVRLQLNLIALCVTYSYCGIYSNNSLVKCVSTQDRLWGFPVI